MSTIFVIGIDSTLGANLATRLAEDYHVVGLAAATKIEPAQVETIVNPHRDIKTLTTLLDDVAPEWIISAEPCGSYCWIEPHRHDLNIKQLEHSRNLARLSADRQISLTCLTTDAIFTGPWMFHEEHSQNFCSSSTATAYRQLEDEILGWNPQAHIVRTNAFGWTPKGLPAQGISRMIEQTGQISLKDLDCMRHATPIHAVHLADCLLASYEHDLSGISHIAGAERVNPWQLMHQLTLHLEGPRIRTPLTIEHEIAEEMQQLRYGYGETSLQTKKIKAAINRSMPMLSEGLQLLREQTTNGFLDRLNGVQTPAEIAA